MIYRHWHETTAYYEHQNEVSPGLMRGLNNKIWIVQRRAYGLRHEKYLRLKVFIHMQPPYSGD